MIRNLKTYGLVLVAVGAIGAVTASAASAVVTPFWFKSDGDWTKYVGAQVKIGGVGDQFTTDAGAISCETTTYAGSSSATTVSSIELTPTYSDCTPVIGFSTVTTNGCSYLLKADNDTGGDPVKYDVETEIKCPPGKDITVDVYTNSSETTRICTIHIPPQNTGTGTTLTNTGTGTITADIGIPSVITYTQTSGGSEGTGLTKCTNFGSTVTSNGSYKGHAIIEGKNTSNAETNIELSTS